jgi:hypothetical protein
VLTAPRELVHNQAFNIGLTTENYRIRDLAELVSEILPHCQIEYAPDASPDQRNYRVNCDRIQRVLPDYHPKWTARKGVVELYEAYQRIGLGQEDFEGPKYKRIAHIRQLIQSGQLDSSLRWVVQERGPVL